MELFLFFLIVAVGGFWYLNHQMKKKAQDNLAASAPYKVETPEVKLEPIKETVEVKVSAPEPVAEVKPAAPAKKPSKPRAPKADKPAAKKAVSSKARVKKPKAV